MISVFGLRKIIVPSQIFHINKGDIADVFISDFEIITFGINISD
jgi:hypothetical protein